MAVIRTKKVEDQIKSALSSYYIVEDVKVVRTEGDRVIGYIRVRGKRTKEDFMKDFVAILDSSGSLTRVSLNGKKYKIKRI